MKHLLLRGLAWLFIGPLVIPIAIVMVIGGIALQIIILFGAITVFALKGKWHVEWIWNI